jgi:PKD domain
MGGEHALRRSGHRRARHLAHSLAVCAVVAAASAAPAAAADAAGILVRLPGGERQLSLGDIRAAVDRPAGPYLLRAPGARAAPTGHPPALSLRKLVTLAGGSPESVSFVSLTRPDGTLSLLRGGDLADPPPFPDGPPIVWVDAGQVRYWRPLRSPSDANAADNIGITEGYLVVRAHQGPLLTVRATADRLTVPAGRPVHLSAEVTGGATAGQSLTFVWTLGDGARKRGAAISHTYARPGVYEAVVTVTGNDDSGGSSAPLRLTVGDTPQQEGDPGGGSGDPRRAPAQGPAHGPAATGGAPSSPPAPSGSGTTTPETPAPAPASPGSGPRAQRPAPESTDTELVRGTLVAAKVAARLPGKAPAGGPAEARRGSEPRRGGVGPLAGILAALAFLGLGIRRERRALRNRPEVTT